MSSILPSTRSILTDTYSQNKDVAKKNSILVSKQALRGRAIFCERMLGDIGKSVSKDDVCIYIYIRFIDRFIDRTAHFHRRLLSSRLHVGGRNVIIALKESAGRSFNDGCLKIKTQGRSLTLDRDESANVA